MDEQCWISLGMSVSMRLVEPCWRVSPLTSVGEGGSALLEGAREWPRRPQTRRRTHLVPQCEVMGIFYLLGLDEAAHGAVQLSSESASLEPTRDPAPSRTHHQVSIPLAALHGRPFFLT